MISTAKTIFWNVDTQYDFMRDDSSYKGKLAVPNARSIEDNLKYITNMAKDGNYQVINTADWHNEKSSEISKNPDFKNTFPEHCMQNTKGSRYIPATQPENPYIIDWEDSGFDKNRILKTRNIVLLKDAFDVFAGNKYADAVVKTINPDRAIVYGVATDVCVNYAVQGLLDRGIEVYVVSNAIKELPGINKIELLKQWEAKGAKFIYTIKDGIDQDIAYSVMQTNSLENIIKQDKR